jgi:hypothetical protein
MREAYASPRGPIWRCMLIAELVAAALWCVLARSMCAAVECIGTARMSRRALHALTPTVAVYSHADAIEQNSRERVPLRYRLSRLTPQPPGTSGGDL